MVAKRILILTNRVPHPLNDGGNLAVNAMIQGYRNAGWQVFLLSMNTSRHYIQRNVLDKLYTDLQGFETVDVDNRVKISSTIHNFLFSQKPSHAIRFYNKSYKKKLIEVIGRFAPDVIQLESVFLASYIPDIKKHTSAVGILRMHNVEYQIWERLAGESKSQLKKIYLKSLAGRMKRFEEHAWPQFDVLLPITDNDADIVRQQSTNAKIITVPFGIHAGDIPVSQAVAEWCGYHIGAMDWLPNEEGIRWFLQKVWPELHKVLPAFKFYFAGRNMSGYFKHLQSEGVYCEGEVEDAQAFIADKKMLIVPIHSGGGIRIKILEAMAAGKLVVSTDVGMQGINALPGKHYLRANTGEEFVHAVQWTLANKNEADYIAGKARELIVNQYNPDTITSGLIDCIGNVLTAKELLKH